MDAAMLAADTISRTEKGRRLRGDCPERGSGEVTARAPSVAPAGWDYCPATLAT
jgi:hypothetical protein